MATSHNNIGMVLKAQGNLPEALARLRQALAIREKVFGAEHPDVARSHANIGALLASFSNSTYTRQAAAHGCVALAIFQRYPQHRSKVEDITIWLHQQARQVCAHCSEPKPKPPVQTCPACNCTAFVPQRCHGCGIMQPSDRQPDGLLAPRDLKSCSGCKVATYCSLACQKKHWKARHKAECAQLKRRRQQPPAS